MVQRVELGGGRKGDPRDSNPPGSVAGDLAGGSDDEQAVLHEQQVLSCEHCRWPWRRRGPEGTGGQLWRAAQDGPQWRAQHRPVPTGRHTWCMVPAPRPRHPQICGHGVGRPRLWPGPNWVSAEREGEMTLGPCPRPQVP